jgi:hypothetical protein
VAVTLPLSTSAPIVSNRCKQRPGKSGHFLVSWDELIDPGDSNHPRDAEMVSGPPRHPFRQHPLVDVITVSVEDETYFQSDGTADACGPLVLAPKPALDPRS